VQNPDAGWTIGDGQEHDNPDAQDYTDSESLYDILEEKIVPIYYQRDGEGLPREWIKMMKASMATVTPRFSTARMVRDYVEQAYLPAAKRSGAVTVATPEQSW
jgi:starch phosphorylase